MKIFTVNIRSGGCADTDLRSELLNRIPKADALVLTEYRDSKRNGSAIRKHLWDIGYRSFAFAPGSLVNGVLVAAKREHARVYEEGRRVCALDIGDLRLCGVYMPQNKAKHPFFQHLLSNYANSGRDTVIIGDFNTGRVDLDISRSGKTHECLDCFAELESLMPEAWRYLNPTQRDYSWSSIGHKTKIVTDWRIDHAFVSPSLIPRLSACEYDHSFRASNNLLTDHSGLLLEIDDFPGTPV